MRCHGSILRLAALACLRFVGGWKPPLLEIAPLTSRRAASAVPRCRRVRAGSPTPAAWPTVRRRAGWSRHRASTGTRPSVACAPPAWGPLRRTRSERPRPRASLEFDFAGVDVGPGVQKDRRHGPVSVLGAGVQKRLAEPVRSVRIESAREQLADQGGRPRIVRRSRDRMRSGTVGSESR